MRTMRRNQINYSANDVWAASAKAYLMNGKTYIKANEKTDEVTPNRDIMKQLLDDNLKGVDATTKTLGENVRQHYKALTFKVLNGAWMSDFDKSAMALADKDTITNFMDFGMIASLPKAYDRAIVKKGQEDRIAEESKTSTAIGKVKQRLELDVTVLRTFLSHKYNCYFITAKTSTDSVVFFASSTIHPKVDTELKIKGTVKGHRTDDDGLVTTQLNRVKIMEEV
tara:strand:- start:1167 stop:1841 length:675 start_codon:yes stop_codon:yes gene_type:complete